MIDKAIINQILKKFVIINSSNEVEISVANKKLTIDIMSENLNKFSKSTGIMLQDFSIAKNQILHMIILDDHIIFFDHEDLPKFQKLFNKLREENEFFIINNETIQIKFGKSEIYKDQIKKSISDSILKKFKERTKISKELNSNFISNEYTAHDFIIIKKIGN